MATNKEPSLTKVLVTIFDNRESATEVAQALRTAGFSHDKIELVTRDVHAEAPEIETPAAHETTTSLWADSTAKGGAIGAGLGAIAGAFMPFPGASLGMVFLGGLAGGVAGGMAGGIGGIDHAVNDDTVNLPSIDEYEQLVKNGESLVVVIDTHEEILQAEEIVKSMPHAARHIHLLHGHAHHEHPTHKV